LIDLAQEQDKLDLLLEDVKSFKALTENKDFYNLLKSPVVPLTKKRKIIDLLMKGKVDEMMLAFIRILITKNREAALPEVAEEFIRQYREIRHITTVKLTSATALSDTVLDNIKSKLSESGAAEQQIELTMHVDPDLLGGFILELDGKVYDSSIAHKLEQVRKQFKGRNLYLSMVSR
jgi:F-type H+-transporting ATPase subunit delta